jgi:hypothetical protein
MRDPGFSDIMSTWRPERFSTSAHTTTRIHASLASQPRWRKVSRTNAHPRTCLSLRGRAGRCCWAEPLCSAACFICMGVRCPRACGLRVGWTTCPSAYSARGRCSRRGRPRACMCRRQRAALSPRYVMFVQHVHPALIMRFQVNLVRTVSPVWLHMILISFPAAAPRRTPPQRRRR